MALTPHSYNLSSFSKLSLRHSHRALPPPSLYFTFQKNSSKYGVSAKTPILRNPISLNVRLVPRCWKEQKKSGLKLTNSSKSISVCSKKPCTEAQSSTVCGCGFCNRRQVLGGLGVRSILSFALPANGDEYTQKIMDEVHPSRPDWYEKLYAIALDKGTKSYEAEVAGYKIQLLNQLKGKAKQILELGIGTGPNIKYYASGPDVSVVGVDPNKQMEKYSLAAATAVGIPESQFKFIRGVGEALPVPDSSMDAVVCTLVLCSVKDVKMTLKEVQRVLRPGGRFIFIEHVAAPDGTLLRFWQNLLDPLQQFVSDGCHLTRQTGKTIIESGFSEADVNMTSIKVASIMSPHVFGTAYK